MVSEDKVARATNLVKITVLILVLVEDGLGDGLKRRQVNLAGVLILVLVEDGLGALPIGRFVRPVLCLNPCFSGGWSRSVLIRVVDRPICSSLNPCFSGGWSRSIATAASSWSPPGLNPCFSGGWSRRRILKEIREHYIVS